MADREQHLLGQLRAAVQRYDMIEKNDRIAVGVSGGKDSLVLLVLLALLRRFYPVPFSLTAITLDPCFGGEENDYGAVAALCDELEVPFVLRRTRLWKVVFEERDEENPCSLCARMRRGALHKAALEAGCSTVALGHHQRDAAETFMMILAIKIVSATNAAHSVRRCASKSVMSRANGMSSVVAKKATAEIVTIQFTKKYENISTIVSAVWGTKTSLRMLMLSLIHI